MMIECKKFAFYNCQILVERMMKLIKRFNIIFHTLKSYIETNKFPIKS